MNQTTKRTVSRRVLNVVIPFERTAGGKLIGSVRIVTPKPYATDEFYLVSLDETQAVFMKETGDRSNHIIDLDFGSCDCAGWRARKTCRHVSAYAALKAAGKI